MKKTLKIIAFACVFLTVSFLYGQNNSSELPVDGASLFPKNNAQYPCITNAQYALLDKEVQDNLNRLHLETTTNRNTLITSFIWPIRNAAGFYQCDYHSVNAYVDQNTAASSIADFNCGCSSKIPNINGTKLGEFKVPTPKLDIQKRIIDEMSSLSARVTELKRELRNKISFLGSAKASILDSAFSYNCYPIF